MRWFLLPSIALLTACSGLSGSARTTFGEGALNAPWYGAYHRPIPERSDAAREDRPVETAEARPARRQATPARSAAPARSARDEAPRSYDSILAAAYVRDMYALNDVEIGAGPLGAVDVYRWTQEHGQIYHSPRPAVGDLAFFHNTHDANEDGRPNDWFTHVGIVESVADDATVTVLSYADGEVSRITLNREHADVERAGGRTLNTRLRTPTRGEPAHAQHMAGQLFAAYGSLLGEVTQFRVYEEWDPESSPSVRRVR